MSATACVTQSDIPGLSLLRRGKVRDVYDLGEELLIVATDRLSAFDHVLPTPIPGKGVLLTKMSAWWFEKTRPLAPNHMISTNLDAIAQHLPEPGRLSDRLLEGRVMLARKARRVDAECVVRGYLAGSAWREYSQTGSVCGHKLPPGLREASKLPEPLFTPATKADEGHDENISRERFAGLVGDKLARELERLSLMLYEHAALHLEARGLILADTKFEFGLHGGRPIVIDEMLTPDSSRFWDAKAWRPGASPESFDKQFVRDHLERVGWDKKPPVPALPQDVVEGTLRRYEQALRMVTA